MPKRTSESSLHEALRFSLGGWRITILPLLAAALILDLMGRHPVLVFAISALALVALAGLLGHATEALAGHIGAAAGGLLNAALGNLTELIIGILALERGEIEVVKASITGSIVGDLLLVFGLAAFVGGLGVEKLTFSSVAVGANTSMLFLAVVALVMPALFQLSVFGGLASSGPRIESLSFWTAGILLASYASSLIFMLKTHRRSFRGDLDPTGPRLSRGAALASLVAAAILVAVASEILVSRIADVTATLGWTQLFIGVVVVAIAGNAAEHSTAILAARAGRMDLALHTAVGSSTQIALFVAPLLVLVSRGFAAPMSLVFHPLEIAAVILSVGAVVVVSVDGETNWLEGLQLIGVYAILAVFFYVVPAS
ncbi:MAG TPA: calcium/proton exchanger [Terriglobia bacterium]|nr:calcium/proton exchanger [Terriglobia bacterium]